MSATTTDDFASSGYAEIPPGHASMRHKLGNPFAYFKKCLKLYADGKGRAGVAEYWSFTLVTYLLYIPLALLMGTGTDGATGEPNALGIVASLALVVVALGLIIPMITVSVRRLHDIGLSGWLYLLVFVPLLGGLFLFICSLIPSSDKPNKHGPSPKQDVAHTFA